MITLARAAALGALLLALLPAFGHQPAGKPRALPTESKEWKGDFDGMIEHRHVRVLAPYSRSLYYNDKGRERGITADFMRDFERYINKKYAKELGKRPITVYIIPTTRDELLTDVADGFGDIAAGNLTVTEERKRLVDFFAPGDFKVSEIVVTGPKSPSIATTDDLAGKTVHVRMASSYYQSLVALNERFARDGKAPITLTPAPEELEDEDLIEMANAG
ncbi:MAG TPA: transporter substrate-binding domain-containing protein, partial [Burkholderiales bacterium]|nr:transporter substrate-binding domain-containing protein [Burkholderiales bacterium]